jgi:hypothetical protein
MGKGFVRLRERVQELQADSLTVLFGAPVPSGRLRELGVPFRQWLQPYTPVAGWIAVDWHVLAMGSNSDNRVPSDAFKWLLDH